MVTKSIRWNQSGLHSLLHREPDSPWIPENSLWYQSFSYFQNTFSIVLTRWTIIRVTRRIIYIMNEGHANLFVRSWSWCWWRNFDSLLFNAEIFFVSKFLKKYLSYLEGLTSDSCCMPAEKLHPLNPPGTILWALGPSNIWIAGLIAPNRSDILDVGLEG